MADKSNLGKVVELLLDLEGFLLDNESFPPWYDVLRHMVEAGNPYEFPHNSWVIGTGGTQREIITRIYSNYFLDEYAKEALEFLSLTQPQTQFSAVALTPYELNLDSDCTFGDMVTKGGKLGLTPLTVEETFRFLSNIPLAIIAKRNWIVFSTNFDRDFFLGVYSIGDDGPTLAGFSQDASPLNDSVMVFNKT